MRHSTAVVTLKFCKLTNVRKNGKAILLRILSSKGLEFRSGFEFEWAKNYS